MTSMYKEITVTDTAGIARTGEFVRTGLPCAQGDFTPSDQFQVISPAGEFLPVQTTVLKTWHDGSIKWLLVDFAATVPANGCVTYRLAKNDDAVPIVVEPVAIAKEQEHWRVSTGVASFLVDGTHCRPFKSILVNGQELLSADGSSFLLVLDDGRSLIPLIESVAVEAEGPLRAILRLEGRFDADPLTSPRFVCRMHFFAGSSQVMLEYTLHNPRAAKHPGGLWDLGDSGSLLFKELVLQIGLHDTSQNNIVVLPEKDGDTFKFSPSAQEIRIYQESSGGKNWDSPVHRTRTGSVSLRFKGYELTEGGIKRTGGMRATPVVWHGAAETGMAAVLPYFWQEFPKAISANHAGLKLEIFPASTPEPHELQGGEQKTTVIYLNVAGTPNSLLWAQSPLVVAPSPQTCHNSGVFADLPPLSEQSTRTDLIDHFTSPEELLNKREAVDEYGWRNFGDIYADHEAVYYKDNQIFISHYNNQYDFTGGAYRKFLATGEAKWFEIAADLARHMLDIDLYHTTLDREEYNQGHFWHTDHYIEAGLSTHRSYSKEQLMKKGITNGGGGPGPENCYTSGLLLHYLLTGNPRYREAVVNMAEWVQLALSGSQTVLSVLKNSVGYLKLLRSADADKRPLFPRYPLTRGTGNAITAALDAFEASGDRKFLDWAGSTICDTIHYQDDIEARDLLNAEIGWSYTVLLGAVAKFIEKKVAVNEYDAVFEYAKTSFLAYAQWMSEHEYPYLDKPEILEFPNETWAAQDLRKSVLFYYAARYAGSDREERYMERARFFFKSACKQLHTMPTSVFTRPIALILQNGWIGARLDSLSPLKLSSTNRSGLLHNRPSPKLSLSSVIVRIGSDLYRAASATTIQRELSWLRMRVSS